LGARKTESRIPGTLQASDLGEAVVATDGRCALVSFIGAPLAVNRENTYVVFVTDGTLATQTASFEWSFTEDPGGSTNQTTDFGQASYMPLQQGYLSAQVKLLDSGSSKLATLSLAQQIAPLNSTLEDMIAAAVNNPGPGMGNTDVLRELVNDHNPYYLSFTLKTPESPESFNKFLFSTLFDGALQREPEKRSYQLDQAANSLNAGQPEFAAAIATGLGVGAVRVSLAAMLLPPMAIPYTELPQPNSENAVAHEQVRELVAAMSESDRIDWFNRVRFPKSNINLCGALLEALRDKFFSGVSFDDVLKKMSGTMADWIILNYNKGPLKRT
jgi:hypothetical protein